MDSSENKDNKNNKDLFTPDRRAKIRFDSPDRRLQLRATAKLKIYGFLAAAAFAAIACAIGYMTK